MSDVDIEPIAPGDWQEFREVRLASLADAPDAFGSTYADWVGAAEERWRARLTDVPLTLVARRAGIVTLRFSVTPGRALETLAGDKESCSSGD